MWFNNALLFQFELDEASDLSASLQEDHLKPCPPHARFTYGWLPAYADEIALDVAGSSLICMGKEERILPRGVIKKILAEKIKQIEQQGRSVKRAERAQLAEELEFELLPKSFSVQKRCLAILDKMSQTLFINTSSVNQAAQLTSLLRKSVAGLSIDPLHLQENLALRFAEWINAPETLPKNFTLASDCLLFSLDDEKKRIHCKGYELPSEEIITLLSQGMATAEISLIWNERIQFTLTQDFIFKRLKSLEYLIDEFNDIKKLDEEYQQQDAALTLLAGELRGLKADLLSGIEKPKTTTAPVIQDIEELAPF